MIFTSLYSDLMTSRFPFEMFGFGDFDFSSACLTFHHLCSSTWVFGIFLAASSSRVIKSK